MTVTEVAPGHLLCETQSGGLQAIVQQGRAFVFGLEGEFGQDAFLLYPAVERLLIERGVTEVFLHTSPSEEMNERLTRIYSDRYGFEVSHVVRVKRLDGAK